MKTSDAAGGALCAGIMVLAAMGLAAPALATGYLKIPDIKGESTRAASAGVEPDEIDVSVEQASAAQVGRGRTQGRADVSSAGAASAGDEHEVEFDIASVAAASRASGHEAAHAVQQRGGAAPQARDSGEAHLDYLTITMENARANVGPVRWMAPESMTNRAATRGRELDKATPILAQRAGAPTDVEAPDPGPQETNFAVLLDGSGSGGGSEEGGESGSESSTGAQFAAPASTEGGTVTVAASWPGCEVGAAYPHILIGEDGGREYRLEDVRVTSCASEEVAFYYEKISG